MKTERVSGLRCFCPRFLFLQRCYQRGFLYNLNQSQLTSFPNTGHAQLCASSLLSPRTSLRPSESCSAPKLLQEAPPHQDKVNDAPAATGQRPCCSGCLPNTKRRMTECVFLTGWLRSERDGTSKTGRLAHSKKLSKGKLLQML